MSLAQTPSPTAADRPKQPDQTAAAGGARPDELETSVIEVERDHISSPSLAIRLSMTTNTCGEAKHPSLDAMPVLILGD